MDETAVLMYTADTTRVSKGAQLTYGNIQASARQIRTWLSRMQDGQKLILPSLPLFDSYVMTICMNLGILTPPQ
jgi:long-chain acyl-CoA synthetase